MKGKIILKKVGIVILFIVLLAAAVLIFYTVREYRPKSIEFLNTGNGTKTLSEGDSFSVLTYNTGYGALSKDEDFFMDGGRKVQPDRKEVVETNLAGISDILKNQAADFYFLQEVDIDAKRSFHINERAYYEKALDMSSIYACNFKCDFCALSASTDRKSRSRSGYDDRLSGGECKAYQTAESFPADQNL